MKCVESGGRDSVDRTNDLIIGVLSGPQYQMKYPGVEAYVVSIARSGFSGRKVMIAWNLHPLTKDVLIKYGFEVVDLYPNWPSDKFFHARVRLVYEYLRDHHTEFRFVHWLDIKDLVLQSDPSAWLENNIGNHSIIGSSESVSIQYEETNWMWANSILGPKRADEIKDFPVFNGGTFSGKAETMAEVFHQVHLLCREYTGATLRARLVWLTFSMLCLGEVFTLLVGAKGMPAARTQCGHPGGFPVFLVCAMHTQ
jgi:hypothetical protein